MMISSIAGNFPNYIAFGKNQFNAYILANVIFYRYYTYRCLAARQRHNT